MKPASTEEALPYLHSFHVGNVGDVLKHITLAAVLERAADDTAYIDSHAGEGRYGLRASGEWTEGVFRLWRDPIEGPGVSSWLSLVREMSSRTDRPDACPGSPFLATKLLGPNATFELFETSADALPALRSTFANDARVRIEGTDGWAGLPEALERAKDRPTVVLIDPPFVERIDWTRTSDVLVKLHRAYPKATFLVWYPVKSWSRPHVMVRAVRDAGVPATTLELISTPLELKRNRLNGSGVLCVNVDDALLDSLAPVLQAVGRRCAIVNGHWSLHVTSWRAPL